MALTKKSTAEAASGSTKWRSGREVGPPRMERRAGRRPHPRPPKDEQEARVEAVEERLGEVAVGRNSEVGDEDEGERGWRDNTVEPSK